MSDASQTSGRHGGGDRLVGQSRGARPAKSGGRALRRQRLAVLAAAAGVLVVVARPAVHRRAVRLAPRPPRRPAPRLPARASRRPPVQGDRLDARRRRLTQGGGRGGRRGRGRLRLVPHPGGRQRDRPGRGSGPGGGGPRLRPQPLRHGHQLDQLRQRRSAGSSRRRCWLRPTAAAASSTTCSPWSRTWATTASTSTGRSCGRPTATASRRSWRSSPTPCTPRTASSPSP